jgi:hypothetical protein
VVHAPRIFVPHAPRTLEDLALRNLPASPSKVRAKPGRGCSRLAP